jgi:hypothetical protein
VCQGAIVVHHGDLVALVVSRSEAALALVCGGGMLFLLCLRALLLLMADAMLRDATTSPAHGHERVLWRLRAALAHRSHDRQLLGGDRVGRAGKGAGAAEGGMWPFGARGVRDGVRREGGRTGGVSGASPGVLRAAGGAAGRVPAGQGRGPRGTEEKEARDRGPHGGASSAKADGVQEQSSREPDIMAELWAAATHML